MGETARFDIGNVQVGRAGPPHDMRDTEHDRIVAEHDRFKLDGAGIGLPGQFLEQRHVRIHDDGVAVFGNPHPIDGLGSAHQGRARLQFYLPQMRAELDGSVAMAREDNLDTVGLGSFRAFVRRQQIGTDAQPWPAALDGLWREESPVHRSCQLLACALAVFARSIPSTIIFLAVAASYQPPILTHLPGSRSL